MITIESANGADDSRIFWVIESLKAINVNGALPWLCAKKHMLARDIDMLIAVSHREHTLKLKRLRRNNTKCDEF